MLPSRIHNTEDLPSTSNSDHLDSIKQHLDKPIKESKKREKKSQNHTIKLYTLLVFKKITENLFL